MRKGVKDKHHYYHKYHQEEAKNILKIKLKKTAKVKNIIKDPKKVKKETQEKTKPISVIDNQNYY